MTSLLVLPSDHLIADEAQFLKILGIAAEMAQRGDYLVTIGIKPTSPETGYGYIEQGVPKAVIRGEEIFEVRSVREKPDLEQAKKLLEQGRFSWNSGMFVWKATTILNAIKQWLPDLYQGLAGSKKCWDRPGKRRQLIRSIEIPSHLHRLRGHGKSS